LNVYFRFCRSIVKLTAKILFGWKTTGSENIPESGGAVIASNHISLLDPPIVGSGTSREVHFAAKKELFGKWYSPILISNLNTFPVKRSGFDRVAVARAVEIVMGGEIVVMFPEGTRSKTGGLGRGRTGAAKVSLDSGAPVIPAAIVNSNKLKQVVFSSLRVLVSYGKPIYPSEIDSRLTEREKLRVYTDRIMEAIAELKSGLE
jgi:1-acyl-sn-glycerol-3-phosphate acyltransferase